MNLLPVPLQPLDPGQLVLMRLRAAASAIVVLAAGAVAEVALPPRVPTGIAMLPALLVAAWLVLVAPRRRYRCWGWAFTGSELHVARGWWIRVHTVVPVARVQHIDISEAPLERRCGVATLVLHTAGTEHSRVSLPGIARGEAEAIRDTIRAAVAQTPW